MASRDGACLGDAGYQAGLCSPEAVQIQSLQGWDGLGWTGLDWMNDDARTAGTETETETEAEAEAETATATG